MTKLKKISVIIKLKLVEKNKLKNDLYYIHYVS